MDGEIESENSVNRQIGKAQCLKFIKECNIYESNDYLKFFDLVLSLNIKHVHHCKPMD